MNTTKAPQLKTPKNYLGFTLVELIVVITILVILGTIAFVQLWSFSGGARDSSRVSDMANLQKALNLSYIKTNTYPIPTDGFGITFSGWVVWTQWSIGDSVITFLGSFWLKMSKNPMDPKYTKTPYAYSLLSTGKEYQIGTVVEDNSTASIPILTPVYAATEPVNAYLVGNYNGLITKASFASTNYYLTLPSIILQDISSPLTRELTNQATQSGNLVLHKKGNLPHTYVANGTTSTTFGTPAQITFDSLKNSNLLTSGSGIVALATTVPLDSTWATTLMNNLYTLYSNSNISSDSLSSAPVSSLITGGSGITALANLFNGTLSKNIWLWVTIMNIESSNWGWGSTTCASFTPGTSCDWGTIYAFELGGEYFITTPGNCTDSSSPICDGGNDTLQKEWNDGNAYWTTTNMTSTTNWYENTLELATIRDSNSDSPWFQTHNAAKYCHDMVYWSKDDWFLPAKNQLNQLYENRVAIWGFAASDYWTSTEYVTDFTLANRQSFWDGNQWAYDKYGSFTVRCIRKY